MKVNLFNHWFKYKVPIDDHADQIIDIVANDDYYRIRSKHIWAWLDEKHDVGQYFNYNENRNYMVFHDKNHYLTFLLKL